MTQDTWKVAVRTPSGWRNLQTGYDGYKVEKCGQDVSFSGQKPQEVIDNIDYVTAGFAEAFRDVPKKLRPKVFAGYQPAPKVEKPRGGRLA